MREGKAGRGTNLPVLRGVSWFGVKPRDCRGDKDAPYQAITAEAQGPEIVEGNGMARGGRVSKKRSERVINHGKQGREAEEGEPGARGFGGPTAHGSR